MLNFRSISLLLAGLVLAGCKQVPAPTTAPATRSPLPVASPVDTATAGTITGVVRFVGKPPARAAIDMALDPACAMVTEPNLAEQYVVGRDAKGQTGLANVYVYVKAGAPASVAPAGAAPVLLDQKGCRFVPHVVAVQQGGRVAFRNSDPTLHNVHTLADAAGHGGLDLTEMPLGPPQVVVFDTVETMLPVRCNHHPWMQAFLNVAPNPYYAVTDADGRFTLPSLPPGTYTLAAVHEKLGEQEIQVTVAPRGTAQAEFKFVM
jgi:plastocyanin